MNKGTHFIGQPIYGQLINLLDKAEILKFSRENGGERYIKHFDYRQHLVVMLDAVIKRFGSIRQIAYPHRGYAFDRARVREHSDQSCL